MADPSLVADLAARIAGIESAGRPVPYVATGPPVHGDDAAIGKYQILGANVPAWTQAALGRPLTPTQFAADPAAQEATATHRLGALLDAHGGSVRDVASIWHSGVPYAQAVAEGRKDSLGTTTQAYADRIAGSGGASTGAPTPEHVALPDGTVVDLTGAPPEARAAFKAKALRLFPPTSTATSTTTQPTSDTPGWTPQTPAPLDAALQASKNVARRLYRAPSDLAGALGLGHPDAPRGLTPALAAAGRLAAPSLAIPEAIGEAVGLGTGRSPAAARSLGDKTATGATLAVPVLGAVAQAPGVLRGLSRAGRGADATQAIRTYLLSLMDPATSKTLPGVEKQFEDFMATEAPRAGGRFSNWGAAGPLGTPAASRMVGAANAGQRTLARLGATEAGGGKATAALSKLAGAVAGGIVGHGLSQIGGTFGGLYVGERAGGIAGPIVAKLASKLADATVGSPAVGLLVRGLSTLKPGTPEYGRLAASLLSHLSTAPAPPPRSAASAPR